jgi:hypothetical protein
MAGVLWTPDEDETLLRMRAAAIPYSDIAIALGRAKKGCEVRYLSLRPQAMSIRAPQSVPPPEREGHEWLQRPQLPAVPAARVRARPSSSTLVSSDHHWPFQDDRVEAVLLQILAAVRPHRYVLNGDLFDLFSLSKYDKDRRAGHYFNLRAELESGHQYLRRVWEIGSAWGLDVVVLPGNHEARWAKYLSKQVPELASHPDAAELWDYRRWFFPDADVCPITFADEVVVAGRCRITHGERVRGQPGQSVRAMIDALGTDVIMGHTHRAGIWTHRVPAFNGSSEVTRIGVEGGCVSRLGADYAPLGDWSNACVLVHEAGGDRWSPELIHIEDGRAIVPSLRAELAA